MFLRAQSGIRPGAMLAWQQAQSCRLPFRKRLSSREWSVSGSFTQQIAERVGRGTSLTMYPPWNRSSIHRGTAGWGWYVSLTVPWNLWSPSWEASPLRVPGGAYVARPTAGGTGRSPASRSKAAFSNYGRSARPSLPLRLEKAFTGQLIAARPGRRQTWASRSKTSGRSQQAAVSSWQEVTLACTAPLTTGKAGSRPILG